MKESSSTKLSSIFREVLSINGAKDEQAKEKCGLDVF